jgi:aspartate-semialdehyde dehydrogenase
MKMLASARSAGKEVEFDGETYVIEELTEDSFDGVDIALFSAGGSLSPPRKAASWWTTPPRSAWTPTCRW